jgi:hypothetical protein
VKVVNNSGVTTTANSTIAINTFAPIAVCNSGITVNLDANGQAIVQGSDLDGGSTDACPLTLTPSQGTFTCSDVGTNAVTLTVSDSYGNTATCNTTVTVNPDNIAPTAICKNITVPLDASGNATITASQVDNGSWDGCGIASMTVSPSTFNCANAGLNTVTLTVTDNTGNVSTCTSTVTIAETVPPVALCKNITINLDANGNASITAQDVDNGSNDNCGTVNLAVSPSNFTCSNVGANTVTLTVTDGYGNISTCNATVTVVDVTAPIAQAQNLTVQLDATGNASITATQVNNGSSDACGIGSLSVTPNTFTCSNVGTNQVTLTVTDNNGNTSTANATVTIEDNVAPVALCKNMTVQLDASGTATITGADIDNGSSDACGIASLVASPNTFTCADKGLNTVTLTVTDNNGNTSTCTSTVTVEDNLAPVLSCVADTAILGANGTVTITETDVLSSSYDNCGIVSYSVTPNTFGIPQVGINNVTVTAVDAEGNTTSCQTTVYVVEPKPNAVCKNITVQLDANGSVSITANDVDNGSNSLVGISNMVVTPSTFNCSNVGTNTVQLVVFNSFNQTDTCSAIVTVEDNVLPTVLTQDVTIYLDAAGQASINVPMIDNGSNDNCGIDNLSLDNTSFTCSNVGVNTVTLTATDVNGNVNSATATVTVVDNVIPNVLTQDVTIYLDANGDASINVPMIDNGSNDNCGIATLTLDNTTFTCSNVGANTVTLTATDVNGNVNTATATVTVIDTVAPFLTGCPTDITVNNLINNCFQTVMFEPPVFTDACGIASVVMSNSNGVNCFPAACCAGKVSGQFPVGVTTVTYTATDNNGNVTVCSFNITVVDNDAPHINNCPADITVNNTPGKCQNDQVMWTPPTPSDNCPSWTMTASHYPGQSFPVGTTTITYTVIDGANNTATCSFDITVIDNEAPVAVAQNATIYLDGTGNASVLTSQIENGSYDNCGIDSIWLSQYNFDCSYVGNNTVTMTVLDIHGNTSTTTATVTVIDNIAPIVSVQNVTIQLDANGQASTSASAIDNGTTDNCAIASLVVSQSNFDCSHVGQNTVTFTATDVNGNVSSTTAVVTVEDNIAPNAIAQNVTIQLDANGQASTSATAVDNGSNDNCGIASLALSQENFDCSHVGTNTVTLTVTDVNNNVSTTTAVVTVEDNIAPNAIAQNVTIQLDANGQASTSATAVDNGSNDNCGIASLALSQENFDCSHVGTNTVTLTVTDVNNNVSTTTAVVTVEDNIAPNAIAQNVTIQLDANGQASTSATAVDNGSNDNCGIASLALSQENFDCSHVGTNTVTLTVTDVNNNVSTTTAVVTSRR